MSHRVRSQYSRSIDHGQENECTICSFQQTPPLPPKPVHHEHSSAREVRVLQGVEDKDGNPNYMCTSCSSVHSSLPPQGLHIVVGDGNVHNIHNPRGSRVRCPPDPLHIDWLTVYGATIPELEHAWKVEYGEYKKAMRILLTGGTADFALGRSRNEIVESIMRFRIVVTAQNKYHPNTENDFVVTTVLNPPKLAWFEDNGQLPNNHPNLLNELKELNAWIIYFNEQKGKNTPRIHRLGVKNCFRNDKDRNKKKVLCHIFNQWCESEPRGMQMHLSEQLKVRLVKLITRHFQAEIERLGPI